MITIGFDEVNGGFMKISVAHYKQINFVSIVPRKFYAMRLFGDNYEIYESKRYFTREQVKYIKRTARKCKRGLFVQLLL